ncbi:hypothetical protein HPB50_009199 [Hyalomma asiaticum]|uniref:Uncharacterized protein n=1 Tax=Hyalomma asiaticum TaxID=266040 RepID=A0ACB7T953_HYAAI|nr:hypothetical protein HPB50_009199 [Hyalomma asiaticum]
MEKPNAPSRPQLEGLASFSSVDFNAVPCTRSEDDRVCQIVWLLREYNQLLGHIGYQLLEDEDDIGDLQLALISRKTTSNPCKVPVKPGVYSRAAFKLFQMLCSVHRCVTLIEVDYCTARYELLLSAIRGCVGVKRLWVYDLQDISGHDPVILPVVVQLVMSMKHVDELVFRRRHHDSVDSMPLPGLPLSFALGTTLKKLNVADLNLRYCDVSQLIALLMKSTVTELAVGTSVCTFVGTDTSLGFADYLVKARHILRSLTLRSAGFCSAPDMERLVNAIAKMTALEELIVDMAPCGSEGTDLFAEVLSGSGALRHLTVALPAWWDRFMCNDGFEGPDSSCRSVRRWLKGLANTTVLETLTLDMLGFREDECRVLLLAVSENPVIRRMTVRRLLEGGSVEYLCRTIWEYGLTERVVLEDHNMSPNSMATLPTCPEVKAVTFYSHCFRAVPSNIRAAFGVLAACEHLISLRVCISNCALDYSALTTLASYLAGPNQLREVEIQLYAGLYGGLYVPIDTTGSPLVKAVSFNTNLSKFTLHQPRLSEADCRFLADALRCSPNLYDLTVSAYNSERFLQLLAPAAARNYTFLNVSLHDREDSDEMKVVVEIARRNRSLVARAAHFVLGNNHSFYCASAIEFVSRHPRLVEILQDKAAVTEVRAKEMIRHAQDSISGLDAYMTAAGVVKDKVVCRRQPGAGTQLDQLNHDCWLHLPKERPTRGRQRSQPVVENVLPPPPPPSSASKKRKQQLQDTADNSCADVQVEDSIRQDVVVRSESAGTRTDTTTSATTTSTTTTTTGSRDQPINNTVRQQPLTIEGIKSSDILLPSVCWCLLRTKDPFRAVFATTVVNKSAADDSLEVAHPKLVSFSRTNDYPEIVAEAYFQGALCCKALVTTLDEAKAILQDANATHMCKGAMTPAEFEEVSGGITTHLLLKIGKNDEGTVFSLECTRNVDAEGTVCLPCKALRKTLQSRKSRVLKRLMKECLDDGETASPQQAPKEIVICTSAPEELRNGS